MKKYYITKNGAPCKVAKNGLHKLGVLMPCAGDDVTIFENDQRKARWMIKRTERAAKKLRASVVFDWAKIAGLVAPGEYVIKEME